MSALFRAEISNLVRMVERHAMQQQMDTNERERSRLHVTQRAARLHAINRKLSKSNRAAIIDILREYASKRQPISANKVSEMTGIGDDTTRKHLKDLASEGVAVAVLSASGKQTRYYVEGKK